MFNALRWIVHAVAPWRLLPSDTASPPVTGIPHLVNANRLHLCYEPVYFSLQRHYKPDRLRAGELPSSTTVAIPPPYAGIAESSAACLRRMNIRRRLLA